MKYTVVYFLLYIGSLIKRLRGNSKTVPNTFLKLCKRRESFTKRFDRRMFTFSANSLQPLPYF